MKTSLLGLVAGLVLTSAVVANACPRSQAQLMCPGDKVVDASGYRGRVTGVNRFQGTISVNYGGSSDGIANMKSLALGSGCLSGYCVGDSVTDASGYRGRIDAINPYSNTLAINYGGSSDGLANLKSVALGMGCVLGYCVGDKVTDASGYKGTISAVNRFNQTAAVNYGGSSDGIANIRSLMSSEYCATYGDKARGMQVFPIMNESLYPSPTFAFTEKRPLRP